MSRRRTLILNEKPNFEQFENEIVDDEAEKRRRVSGLNKYINIKSIMKIKEIILYVKYH